MPSLVLHPIYVRCLELLVFDGYFNTEFPPQLVSEALFTNNADADADDEDEDKEVEPVIKPTKTGRKRRGKENQEARNGEGKVTGKLTGMKSRQALKHKMVSNRMSGMNLIFFYSLP